MTTATRVPPPALGEQGAPGAAPAGAATHAGATKAARAKTAAQRLT
ncbi:MULTISPECIES: hypothetical protein [Candidatus Neomicrothrix]|nr:MULTISPECIES: hypothetical protein [Microthrix]NLH65294.1 hypothetical protein [Candidatus Microthrix parvicella]MBK6501407.1 hypothetical protein [Candidatus Microthrix sp.]MBK7020014.1 hypothetical protein [Candidatus Microthrix sp.]MBK7322725.1 hypothetical protein [Candidatus Microthrix sp.]MBL0202858.1 hypothetical protein [Candidatus Microthrix sp.]